MATSRHGLAFVSGLLPGFALLAVLLFGSGAARAEATDNAAHDIWLPRINAALSSMGAISGQFEQKLPNGAHAAGDYAIDWPQNLRFAYHHNGESVVTVKGKFVAVQERPGAAPNWFPVSFTPLAMIRQAVAEGIDAQNLIALDIQDEIYAATLRDPQGEVAGEATLYFTRADNQLYAWRLVDVQNLVTLVRLRAITRHETLDKSVFAIVENDESEDD